MTTYMIAEEGIDSFWSSRDGWVRNPNYATLTTDIIWLSQMLEKLRKEYAMPIEIKSYPRGFRFK